MNDGTCYCAKYNRNPVRVNGICAICNPGPIRKPDPHPPEPAWSWAKTEYEEDARRAYYERRHET